MEPEGAESRRYTVLRDGRRMPLLGLGTASWNSRDKVKQAVEHAVLSGIRLLDCAAFYGTEAPVGEAVASCVAAGAVRREDLFITGKLWNTDHRPHKVLAAVERSLKDLRTTYIDQFMIHWPTAFKEGEELVPLDEEGNLMFDTVDYVDTWKALEECVDAGLVKSLGVSNFNEDQIRRLLLVAKHKPVCSQVECHPYFIQETHLQFCRENGICVMCFSPLGSYGNPWIKAADLAPLEDAVVKEIASRHGRTAAQVILKWAIDRDTAVIPGSVSREHILLNSQVFDIHLSAAENAAITALDRGHRFIDFPGLKDHPDYPFK